MPSRKERHPIVLAQGSPIFHSICEGELAIVLRRRQSCEDRKTQGEAHFKKQAERVAMHPTMSRGVPGLQAIGGNKGINSHSEPQRELISPSP